MRRLIVAALVLAVALLAAWFVTRQQSEQERRQRQEERLLFFDERAVSRLTMQTRAEPPWTFVRSEGDWRVEAPVADDADDLAIAQLLSSVRTTTVAEIVEDPSALDDYGLETPALRVTVETSAGEAHELVVGDVAPTGKGVFARVPGRDGVLVLDRVLADVFLRIEPFALRDHRLVDVMRSEIEAVELGTDPPVRLVRRGDAWWLTEPVELPAGGPQVERLLTTIDGARIGGFVDAGAPADAEVGLGDAAFRVRVEAADREATVYLGAESPDGWRYARREGRSALLAVRAGEVAGLPATIRQLVSDRLTAINRYAVASFEYTLGSERVAAEKTADAWTDPGGRAIDDGAVYSFLARVLEAKVDSWERAREGEDTPTGVLTLRLDDGSEDRVTLHPGNRARVDSVPGVTYTLAAAPPSMPTF